MNGMMLQSTYPCCNEEIIIQAPVLADIDSHIDTESNKHNGHAIQDSECDNELGGSVFGRHYKDVSTPTREK